MKWRLQESAFAPADQFYVIAPEPDVRVVIYSRALLLSLWRQYYGLCATATEGYLPVMTTEELLLSLAQQRLRASGADVTPEQRHRMLSAYREGVQNLLTPWKGPIDGNCV